MWPNEQAISRFVLGRPVVSIRFQMSVLSLLRKRFSAGLSVVTLAVKSSGISEVLNPRSTHCKQSWDVFGRLDENSTKSMNQVKANPYF